VVEIIEEGTEFEFEVRVRELVLVANAEAGEAWGN